MLINEDLSREELPDSPDFGREEITKRRDVNKTTSEAPQGVIIGRRT